MEFWGVESLLNRGFLIAVRVWLRVWVSRVRSQLILILTVVAALRSELESELQPELETQLQPESQSEKVRLLGIVIFPVISDRPIVIELNSF